MLRTSEMFLDERSATCLALLAEAPEATKELVETLKGQARDIGQALVERNTEGDDLPQRAAKAILETAKRNQTLAATLRIRAVSLNQLRRGT